jgi:hypothetical protein
MNLKKPFNFYCGFDTAWGVYLIKAISESMYSTKFMYIPAKSPLLGLLPPSDKV